MGRRLDVDQLVGSNEIAQRLGFHHPQLVHYYKNHDSAFPHPVLVLGRDRASTHIWYWPDVERWAIRRGRLPKPKRLPSGPPQDSEGPDEADRPAWPTRRQRTP